jgi:hypothetical protein
MNMRSRYMCALKCVYLMQYAYDMVTQVIERASAGYYVRTQ